MKNPVAWLVLLSILASRGFAAEAGVEPAPDVAEPGSIEAIAQFTTEPRFLSPWVAYVPLSDSVPSPAAFLGYQAGAAGELTQPARIVEYVRRVGQASIHAPPK